MAQDRKQERRIEYLKGAVALEIANMRWERSRKNALDALTLLSDLGAPTEILTPLAKYLGTVDKSQGTPLQEV